MNHTLRIVQLWPLSIAGCSCGKWRVSFEPGSNRPEPIEERMAWHHDLHRRRRAYWDRRCSR